MKKATTTKVSAKDIGATINEIVAGVSGLSQAIQFAEATNKALDVFRSYKVSIEKRLDKTRGTTPIAQQFYDGLVARGIAPKTAANYLTDIRYALVHNKPFVFNAARFNADKAKKTAANKTNNTPKTTEAKKNIGVGDIKAQLATAIMNVRKRCQAADWTQALDGFMPGFSETLIDFLSSEAAGNEADETDETDD